MLTVETYLSKSQIHGFGLFAATAIKKGTTIWTFKEGFDILLTDDQFLKLPDLTRDYIMHYSYYDDRLSCHVICGDNARFFNKSETPNCAGLNGDIYGDTIAARDIKQDEELTEIYYNKNDLDKAKKDS